MFWQKNNNHKINKLSVILLFIALFYLYFIYGCGCKKEINRSNSTLDNNLSENKSQKSSYSQQNSIQQLPNNQGLNSSNNTNQKMPNLLGELKTKISPEAEKKLVQSVKFMQTGEYDKALTLLQEVIENYPNTEEASVAEYCLAEIYFRNKSNDRALQIYKQIVQKYPNTLAAENAKEAIVYLETFSEIEKEYISPEIDDRKRRTGF